MNMSKFEEAVKVIKFNLPIEKFIGGYTDLIQMKISWRGTCTFCNEEKALSVSQEKQVFYCFNCHIGGDILTFVAKEHRMSLKMALIFLTAQMSLCDSDKPNCKFYEDCGCCITCTNCNCEKPKE